MTDEIKEPDLTDEERRVLREMLQERARTKWFWLSIRTWVMWCAAVAGGITLTYDALARFVKSLGGS